MKATQRTLEFYSDKLGDIDDETVERLCTPSQLLKPDDDDMRIQDFKFGDYFKSGHFTTDVNGRLQSMAANILQQTLIDTDTPSSVGLGSSNVSLTTDVPKLVLNPKVITGTLKSLSVRAVSPDEMAEVLKAPVIPKEDKQGTHLPDRDSFFLVEGEVKISRSIGFIASGIRLSEFERPMFNEFDTFGTYGVINNSLYRHRRGVPKGSAPELDRIYSFKSSSRRGTETATSPTGALAASIYNARNVEAANLARPFGGMHE